MGQGAISLLTFIGHESPTNSRDLASSLLYYGVGVMLGAVSGGIAFLAQGQLTLAIWDDEAKENSSKSDASIWVETWQWINRHYSAGMIIRVVAMVFILGSYEAFLCGSIRVFEVLLAMIIVLSDKRSHGVVRGGIASIMFLA